MTNTVRVLIVDDSPMVRRVLSMGLTMDPGIEVVGTAGSATEAWAIMQAARPDVITLDVEMPATDGVTFLSRYMPVMPIPTVVISSFTSEMAPLTLQAMEAGAVDVIEKPTIGLGDGLSRIMPDICERVRAAAQARPLARRAGPTAGRAAGPSVAMAGTRRLIAIGSSTGGVQALHRIMPMFAEDTPPVVIVQHMPVGFTAAFARRLDGACAMRIVEGEDQQELKPGTAYVAPGGTRHMTIVRVGHRWVLRLVDGDPVCFSRPSVDVLFNSVAAEAGRDCAAALLTGMGRDGAAGLLAIRRAGGRTIAQDEATSVVYGMPLAAADCGAAETILPLDEIPDQLIRNLSPARSRMARL